MDTTVQNLRKHGFTVLPAKNRAQAGEILQELTRKFMDEYKSLHILSKPVVSYGDSLTLYQIDEAAGEKGILKQLRHNPDIVFLDGFKKEDSREEKIRIRREALLSDFYITGVNAVSREGALYWVDMIGNRIASISMGARNVVIVAGKNKIVPLNAELEARVRTIAGPQNIARHPGFKTPCAKTGVCMDCNSPDRICNMKLTLERCYPKGRISVILIDEELGL